MRRDGPVVVHRGGAWVPAEHIDMPMHHATAIQWDNLDGLQGLEAAGGERLRFTFTVLSESREHRAEQSTVFTTFVARVEMICSASAPADRPEGAVFRSMDIGAEQFPALEAAMVETGRELGRCTSNAQCTIVETPMCGDRGVGLLLGRAQSHPRCVPVDRGGAGVAGQPVPGRVV